MILQKNFLVAFALSVFFLIGCDNQSQQVFDANTTQPSQTINIPKEYIGQLSIESIPALKLPPTQPKADQRILYASPKGQGDGLTPNEPTSLKDALQKLRSGDILRLKGGVYKLSRDGLNELEIPKEASGTPDRYTVIESYPGEAAVIDGSAFDPNDSDYSRNGGIQTAASYIKIRNLEVKNSPRNGIQILPGSKGVVIEGCRIHHNKLSGIHLWKTVNATARFNLIHHNSDFGYTFGDHDNGNNADGISVSYSEKTLVEYNYIYLNSDDGIDLWGSPDGHIRGNLVAYNGYLDKNKTPAGKGNGEGIKVGGGVASYGKIVEYNIAWKNKKNGIAINGQENYKAIYRYNTAWKNGHNGFTFNDDTTLIANISSENTKSYIRNNGHMQNNSWQHPVQDWDDSASIPFMSTDETSPDFLKPKIGSGFENIGAHIRDSF